MIVQIEVGDTVKSYPFPDESRLDTQRWGHGWLCVTPPAPAVSSYFRLDRVLCVVPEAKA